MIIDKLCCDGTSARPVLTTLPGSRMSGAKRTSPIIGAPENYNNAFFSSTVAVPPSTLILSTTIRNNINFLFQTTAISVFNMLLLFAMIARNSLCHDFLIF
jgi:hypothetical protein